MYYEKLLPYLKPAAAEAYHQMLGLGIDSDLAILVIEKLVAPDSIYDLPEDDESE